MNHFLILVIHHIWSLVRVSVKVVARILYKPIMINLDKLVMAGKKYELAADLENTMITIAKKARTTYEYLMSILHYHLYLPLLYEQ